jgi:hypothetical protein
VGKGVRIGLRGGRAMNLDMAFRAVYGRAPDPEETNRFNQVARELDIRENDAIWAVTFPVIIWISRSGCRNRSRNESVNH